MLVSMFFTQFLPQPISSSAPSLAFFEKSKRGFLTSYINQNSIEFEIIFAMTMNQGSLNKTPPKLQLLVQVLLRRTMLSRLRLLQTLLVLSAGLACLDSVRGQAGSAAGKKRCSPAMPLFASRSSASFLSFSSLALLSQFSLSLSGPAPLYPL